MLLAPVQGCMSNEAAACQRAGSKYPQSGLLINMSSMFSPFAHFTCMWNILQKHVARRTCWSEWVGGKWRRISAGRKEIEINLRFAQASRAALTQGGGDAGGLTAFTGKLNFSALPAIGKFPWRGCVGMTQSRSVTQGSDVWWNFEPLCNPNSFSGAEDEERL